MLGHVGVEGVVDVPGQRPGPSEGRVECRRSNVSYPSGRLAGVDPDGLIVWSSPSATCGLVVVGGDVVDGPPYARKLGLVGRDARQVWREQARRGVGLQWLPDPPHTVVESWTNNNFGTLTAKRVKLATNGVTWQVQVRKGKTDGVLRYRTEDDARQELDLLLSEGEWRRLSL